MRIYPSKPGRNYPISRPRKKNEQQDTGRKAGASRIVSIDICRAVTMLLMVFVNDIAGLANIPGWLKHTQADYDGMGLSDVVFPAFLFIVGLSIPHAIKNRITKGENFVQIAKHIFLRSVALIGLGRIYVKLKFWTCASQEKVMKGKLTFIN